MGDNRNEPEPTWLSMPDYPTPAELMSPTPGPLPVNNVSRPPLSKADYLETHYKLLRHEGINPLRESIQEFKQLKLKCDSRATHIYTNVRYIIHDYYIDRSCDVSLSF